MCIDCNDNLMLPIRGEGANVGINGTSSYFYVASASDSTGANFTYPAVLDPPGTTNGRFYIATLTTSTPIASPVATDFGSTFTRIVGIDGTAGTNGTDGLDGVYGGVSFEYRLLGFGLSGDPGARALSYQGAAFTVGTNSALQVNITDANSVNISNVLDFIGSSTSTIKAVIKITKLTDSSAYTVLRVNSMLTIGPSYRIYNVTCLATSSPTVIASDDVLIEFAVTGDKGSTGATGPAGAFIIGTLSGDPAYPATSAQGEAYRFTDNGIVSDTAGGGGTNPRRYFINDVLYATASSSGVPDGTKWFIWHGFPRPFFPGVGTDSLIQNTATPGTAAGESSIALFDSAQATGDHSIAARSTVVTGDNSNGLGRSSTISGDDVTDVGVNNNIAARFSLSYGNQNVVGAAGSGGGLYGGIANTVGTDSDASLVIGRQAVVGNTVRDSIIAGIWGKVDNSTDGVLCHGYDYHASIKNSKVHGGGKWSSGSGGGKSQIIEFPLSLADLAQSTTAVLATGLIHGDSSFALPQSGIWSIEATIISTIKGGANIDDVAIWNIKFQIQNKSTGGTPGTAVLLGNILTLDDAGTYSTVVALATPIPPRYNDAANDSTLQINGSANTISFVPTGATGAASDITDWSGSVKITQLLYV